MKRRKILRQIDDDTVVWPRRLRRPDHGNNTTEKTKITPNRKTIVLENFPKTGIKHLQTSANPKRTKRTKKHTTVQQLALPLFHFYSQEK